MEPSRRRRHLPAAILALLILAASLVPVPESAGDRVPTLFGLALDKWVHAVGYAALTGVLAWARNPRTAGPAVALTVAVVAYGGGIELLQGLLSSRGTSGADFVANTTGALLACVAWLVVRRHLGQAD
ncbi:VanZ family protein [Halomicroarcula sp. GCM10025709]|uniref:VanZ family protein n=1 Tax=Haloarcula TaxID=2237 RepID=UPI0024C27FED|nr:VanZ family protein [Halomicroarcula sp. YJ-61-S]